MTPPTMRVIIAGGRNCNPTVEQVAAAVVASGFPVGLVVSGTCRGVDQAGEAWAAAAGVPVKQYPADWNRHGNAAGPIRNKIMAENADALIAFWDGESKGTRSMISLAKERKLFVHVVRV